MALQEAQQVLDAKVAGNHRSQKAHQGGQQGQVAAAGLLEPLGDMVQAGAGDDGGGQEEEKWVAEWRLKCRIMLKIYGSQVKKSTIFGATGKDERPPGK
jgi:hypothetical protein